MAKYSDASGGRTRASAGLALAAAVVLVSGGCGADAPARGKGQTIEIGYIAPFGTGFSGQNATDVETGIQAGLQYLQEHGGVLNGATIKVTNGTETGQAAVVSSTVRTMLGNGIRIFIGPGLTADCLAAGPLLDKADAFTLTSCVTTSLTGKNRATRNLYRAGTNDDMQAKAIGYVLGKQFTDVTQIDTFAYDTEQGHSTWSQIQKQLKALNPSIAVGQAFFIPQASTDYRAQLGAMANAQKGTGKRALALLTYGPGVLNFIQQGTALGLMTKYEVIITTNQYYVEAVSLKGAAPSMWNAYDVCHYQLFDNSLMKYLVDYLKTKADGRKPSDWTVNGFNRILIIAAAINKAGSSDAKKVMAALDTISVDTAVGKITMNPETHQADVPTSVCNTVGDPSAEDGVKLVTGTAVAASITLGSGG